MNRTDQSLSSIMPEEAKTYEIGRQEIITWVRSHFGIWNHGAEFLYLVKSLGYELTPKEAELIK